MKKYLLIATVALGLTFTACSGAQKQNDSAQPADSVAQPAAVAQPVDTTAAAAATDQSAVLAQYEQLVNKAIELQGKVQKGDASAAQELTKLSEQMTSVTTQLQNAAASLTPEQTQKLTDLAKKWADATAPKAAKK